MMPSSAAAIEPGNLETVIEDTKAWSKKTATRTDPCNRTRPSWT